MYMQQYVCVATDEKVFLWKEKIHQLHNEIPVVARYSPLLLPFPQTGSRSGRMQQRRFPITTANSSICTRADTPTATSSIDVPLSITVITTTTSTTISLPSSISQMF